MITEYTRDTNNIFFPNQKEPTYDPDDTKSVELFTAYWVKEKERCIDGFHIADGQVHIPGKLYFHLVYGKIARYIEKEIAGEVRKIREISQPLFRDIDWDIFNDLEQCAIEGKFYALVGSRDFGKSIIAASCSAHQYTFFDKSESLISSGDAKYIKLVWDKVEDFLLNIHPIFRRQRLKSDWKVEILAGWKDKKTGLPHEKSSFSSIKPINYKMGNSSMAANGTRPGFHLFDEIGTLPNLIGCFKDSDGCWWSGGGNKPSCLVMLCGTGGDMEVGAEAAEMFYNPDSYNLLSFENKWEGGGRIGRFIPATRAKLKYKYPKKLSEYLGISHPDLDAIEILVSDEEKCLKEWWEPEHNKALKSGNQKTLLKFKAYWPIKPSDSFLVLTRNDFNVEAAKAQQNKIKNEDIIGANVRLYHNGDKIVHESVDKLPITEFPLKSQSPDAPVVIWEPPMQNPPFGLFVAGVDSYRQDTTEYGDSLGAIYIYKRMHELNSDKFQDMFVAAYVARPKTADEWNETARLLIKYYNAVAMVENDELGFIRYMINKGDGHYLHDQPDWLKEYVPNTSQQRPKGISRQSKAIRNFLDGQLQSYLDEVLYQEQDENGSVIREVLGVSRIRDPMLLEEIIKFNKDGNFDRIVAAELAIATAHKMKPIGKVSNIEMDPRFKALYGGGRSAGQSVFEGSNNSYSARKGKSKLFL